MQPRRRRQARVVLSLPDVTAAITWWEGAFGLARRFIHEGGDYGELVATAYYYDGFPNEPEAACVESGGTFAG
jgi:hypothetical protein